MISATIIWFDALSGEGMVRLNDGRSVYVHVTAIDGISRNNRQWPTSDDRHKLARIGGQACEVELIEDTTFVQVSKLILESK